MKKKLLLIRMVLFVAIIILLVNIVSAYSVFGIGVMLNESLKISRGMSLFFAALVMLAILPWFNKYWASMLVLFIGLGLSRGLLRAGEQDVVKTFMSMKFGLWFGVQMVIPLIIINILFVLGTYAFKSIKPANLRIKDQKVYKAIKHNLTEKQIINAIEYGLKKKYTLRQIIKALKLKGASFWQINHCIYLSNSKTREIFHHYKKALFARYVLLIITVITLIFFFFDFIVQREKEFYIYLIFLLAIIIYTWAYMKNHQKQEKRKINENNEFIF